MISKLIHNSIVNTRDIIQPLELDVYSEEFNLAVEYDGLLYHSYGKNKWSAVDNLDKEDPNYHLNKTLLCEEKGIQLFHIFENEWSNNKIQKAIWTSTIKNKINQNKAIPSSHHIKDITEIKADEFLENNHLEGAYSGSTNIGLFYKDELIQVLSVKNDYSVFCSKIGYQDDYSCLLKYYIDYYDVQEVKVSINRRFSDSSEFSKLSFELIKDTPPDYFYIKNCRILLDKNHYLSSAKSADDMFNDGYRKIYDCGRKELRLVI